MQYDERASGQQIEANVNGELEISLPETRTAGYKWIVRRSGAPILELLEDKTIPRTPGVGGTGRHLWRFRVLSPGDTDIELDHIRPWEDSAEPSRTFRLKVRVRS